MAALVPNPGSKGRRRAATYDSNPALISRVLAAGGETWSTGPAPGGLGRTAILGSEGAFSGHKMKKAALRVGGCRNSCLGRLAATLHGKPQRVAFRDFTLWPAEPRKIGPL
jgi:hypothetical protein